MTGRGGLFRLTCMAILFTLALGSARVFYCPALSAAGLVNINTAGAEELDGLPGIGAVKAQAIVAYREASGSFMAIEDIMNVPGIGQVTFDNIKALITVVGGSAEAPVCGNGDVENGEDCDDGNTAAGDGCDALCRMEASQEEEEEETPPAPDPGSGDGNGLPVGPAAGLGDVVINEFVSDPADGEVEWVEFYNTTMDDFDLAGWTLEDGSGAKTALGGVIAGSGSGKFRVVEKPKGNLNNGGDLMVLRTKAGKLIDQVAYGSWEDGDKSNNAPAAGDPGSTARKMDGYNTHNNANDFAVTATPTKGRSNIITGEVEEDGPAAAERAAFDYSDDIVISEIMPNPYGSDEEDEFIELYNRGARDVDLLGWRLGDNTSRKYKVESIKCPESGLQSGSSCVGGINLSSLIKAGEYKVFYRTVTKLALNNGAESVKLYRPLEEVPVAAVSYDKAVEGWSFVNTRISTDSLQINTADGWVWTEIITPGEENVIKTLNRAPMVDFECPETVLPGVPVFFDSSDTIDEDGDLLTFVWEFGDGATNTLPLVEHTFFREGAFTVKLAVSDGKSVAVKEKILAVGAGAVSVAGRTAETGAADGGWNIRINEFLPDPEGGDEEGEWIELFNAGGTAVSMLDWRLDDEEGGSKPYRFAEDWRFEPGRFRLIERAESKLALNNTGDAVRLFDPAGALVDEVVYGKAATGEAYARGENGKWFWSAAATPGERNIISVSDSQDGATVVVSQSGRSKAAADEDYREVPLYKIKDMEAGDRIRASGTVAVLPGVLGSQYFYIVGETGGIQVYSYSKHFPELKVGDLAVVSGELSQTAGEWRLKTKTAEDIVVSGRGSAPAPLVLTCETLTEDSVGRLIKIAGTITDRKGATVYFDDGTAEAVVYIKSATGISAKGIEEGREAEITGLIGRTASGLRLMPRSPEDVVYTDVVGEDEVESGIVLGEVAANDEWVLPARDKRREFFAYLLIVAGAVIAVLAGLLIKNSLDH